MGRGIVGGPLISIDDLSRNAAAAGVRLLNHESPENVRTPPQLPGPSIFDWRELRRWDISETLLPVGSIVQFREPTLWQKTCRPTSVLPPPRIATEEHRESRAAAVALSISDGRKDREVSTIVGEVLPDVKKP